MLLRQMILAAVAAMMCLTITTEANAQRGGWGGGGESKLMYLADESVQKELELLDDQAEQLRDVNDEARNVMRNAFSGMRRENFRDMSREERDEMMAGIRLKIKEDMKSVEEKVNEILVPHQLERLDQLLLQGKMRRGGMAESLKDESLREKLGLSEQEAEAVQKKEEEVKKELEKQIKKLRSEAQDKILSVLPAEKREKIKGMIGEAFEMNRSGRGRGGDRSRGGRGGRGGF